MKKYVLSIVMVLFCVSICCAADVYTKEGKRFIGVISEETDEYVQLKMDDGTIIINKEDIMHVERSSESVGEQHSESFIQRVKKFYHKVSRNNWFFVRRRVKQVHGKLFLFLNQNRLYQLIAKIGAVDSFRAENYKAYVFAVYMLLLLIVGMVLSVVQRIVYVVYCKIRGIKPRYDG